MFAGHLAPGLIPKKMERRLNLGWLFFAGLFHDFLFGILVLLGLEQVRIPVNFAQTKLFVIAISNFPMRDWDGYYASLLWLAWLSVVGIYFFRNRANDAQPLKSEE